MPRLSGTAAAVRVAAASAVFWALAAGVLHLVAPALETFPRLLTFAECVGLTMVACVMLLRSSPRVSRLELPVRWLVIGAVSIPVGYFVGHQIAFLLLGEPMRMVGHEHVSLVPIVFTVLVGGVGLHHYATRERLSREAAARSQAQRLAVEAQLRLLRTQLEPHMLFNTLANLRSLVREDADRAELMIDQLIVYLRSTLAASRTDATTLRHEFAQLRAYLEIMALRMGPRLQWRLDLPQALEATPVPSMLLQPLVENAIKHGLEPKMGAGSIEVVARQRGPAIEIEVIDSGIGLPPVGGPEETGAERANSYGLDHVRERLRAVYGEQGSLRLERRTPSGVRAVVSIAA